MKLRSALFDSSGFVDRPNYQSEGDAARTKKLELKIQLSFAVRFDAS